MMLKEHKFDTGQVRLNYVKGPENGPPLVLLHGLSEHWLDFLPIVPHLLLRHTVYAVDLRGHGKSGRVPGRYRCSDYGDDIRSFLEGTLAQPAILFGFSTGGLVAAYLGARYPELVSALILEEPALWDTTHIPWVVDYFTRCRELTSRGKTAQELREILPIESAWDRKWAARLSQLDPGPLVAWFERSHWEGFQAETMLQNISCPVLLIYGDPENRSVLTPEQVELILSAIPDCVANFVDAGHALHMTQPTQTTTIVTQFLDSLYDN
jgi:pimeloyl-ACP methyl ester carboxylesterase